MISVRFFPDFRRVESDPRRKNRKRSRSPLPFVESPDSAPPLKKQKVEKKIEKKPKEERKLKIRLPVMFFFVWTESALECFVSHFTFLNLQVNRNLELHFSNVEGESRIVHI